MAQVLIIDYGMGNLQSVKRAFEECGASPFISDDPRDMTDATHVVLPGVGSFGDGMKRLSSRGWPPAIEKEIMGHHLPFLGICLGMQLLAEKGFEGGEFDGLGLVPGVVKKFLPPPGIRIPHVGWNEVYPEAEAPLFRGLAEGTDFYFVHSYHFIASNPENVIATTPYCGTFVSAINNKNVFGVQFHPEKSQKYGFRVIKNFLLMN